MPRVKCPRTRDGNHVWYHRLFPSRVVRKNWCVACGTPHPTSQESK